MKMARLRTSLRAIVLPLALLAILSSRIVVIDAQDPQADVPDSEIVGKLGLLDDLFGPAVKAYVDTVVKATTMASPLACPLTFESLVNHPEEPTLHFYNNHLNPQQSLRVPALQKINEETVRLAQLDPNQVTYILVHGCMGGIYRNVFMTATKNIILGYSSDGTCARSLPCTQPAGAEAPKFRPNVIIVDWSNYAAKQLYLAGRNVEPVARRLALQLKQLVEVGGLRPELMHCIGHSYGAHVCARAARYVFPGSNSNSSARLGRITGLDPGGFCYNLGVENEAAYPGMKPSDALLVEALYSNRGVFGATKDLAQYNLLVNDGTQQPICSEKTKERPAYIADFIGYLSGKLADVQTFNCEHFFPCRFPYQRLPAACTYVGYSCDSYESFLRGRCGFCSNVHQCYSVNMEYQTQNGSSEQFQADSRAHSSYFNDFTGSQHNIGADLLKGAVPYDHRRRYYMRTSNQEPYCSISYRVRVHLSDEGLPLPKSLRFIDAQGQVMRVKSAASTTELFEIELGLFGPWTTGDAAFGLDNKTMTALFDLDATTASGLLAATTIDQLQGCPIKSVVVQYDNSLSSDTQKAYDHIKSIALDYMGTSNPIIRSKLSLSLEAGQFEVSYK